MLPSLRRVSNVPDTDQGPCDLRGAAHRLRLRLLDQMCRQSTEFAAAFLAAYAPGFPWLPWRGFAEQVLALGAEARSRAKMIVRVPTLVPSWAAQAVMGPPWSIGAGQGRNVATDVFSYNAHALLQAQTRAATYGRRRVHVRRIPDLRMGFGPMGVSVLQHPILHNTRAREGIYGCWRQTVVTGVRLSTSYNLEVAGAWGEFRA